MAQLKQVQRGTSYQPRGNSWGTLALIGAIIGLLICWIPIVGMVIGVIAIGLSSLGMARGRKTGGDGTGVSAAGLVISIIATVISTVITIPVLLIGGAAVAVASNINDARKEQHERPVVTLEPEHVPETPTVKPLPKPEPEPLPRYEPEPIQPSDEWTAYNRPAWLDECPNDTDMTAWLRATENRIETGFLLDRRMGVVSIEIDPVRITIDANHWLGQTPYEDQMRYAEGFSDYFEKKGFGSRVEFWVTGYHEDISYDPNKIGAQYTKEGGYEELQEFYEEITLGAGGSTTGGTSSTTTSQSGSSIEIEQLKWTEKYGVDAIEFRFKNLSNKHITSLHIQIEFKGEGGKYLGMEDVIIFKLSAGLSTIETVLLRTIDADAVKSFVYRIEEVRGYGSRDITSDFRISFPEK